MLSGIAIATSPQSGAVATYNEQEKLLNNSPQDTGGLLSEINQKMPNLKLALIIFTSFNGILIVLGAIALVFKKRLEDQSASTLASIKATQSRTMV